MYFLEQTNPHWFGEEDEDVGRWRTKKIHVIPEWLSKIPLRAFSVNFILGPRRVGKTTGMKLLIKDLIERGIEPRKIVYVNVDLIPDLRYFQDVLRYVSENKFEYVFIDEATSLENWWRPLRGFVDAGLFKRCVLVVSGSLSLKVKKHAELFPGRTGLGKQIEVLPLSFPEFFKLFNPKPRETEIRKLFKRYLRSGGFLGALENEDAFMKEIVAALESELLKIGLSPKLAFEIFSSLLDKIPSPISYQAIASDVGVDYKTVRSYLETFESMYVVQTAYWKGDRRIKYRKEKKIFFRDPLVLRAVSFWTSTKFLESAMYEHVVQEHLFRKFGEIYYYRNRCEIDCVAGGLKIEVKAGKPHRRYPKGVKILDEQSLPQFLMKLG